VELAASLDRLQGPDPGVEVLGREFLFEAAQALVPEGRLHGPAGLERVGGGA
jgi:hypothetical protein